MRMHPLFVTALIIIVTLFITTCGEKTPVFEKDTVVMKTSKGEIQIQLYPDKAPVSVQNFLQYVEDGHYDNSIFHRVRKGFMIQGGGFDAEAVEKPTRDPIINEAANGLKNLRGTVAYARTPVINSATSQFFINHVDNPGLDFRDSTQAGFNYCVFGKVTSGMEVVDAIAEVPTDQGKLTYLHNGQLVSQMTSETSVPKDPVLIKEVRYYRGSTK